MNKDYARHVDKYPGVVQGADGFCPQKCATYIIRENNGTYEAINGKTGEMDYKSTEANDVFDYAADSKGLLYLSKGNYYVTSLKPPSNIDIIGSGYDTYLKLKDNVSTGYLPDSILSSVFSLVDVENVTIKNLRCDGNYESNLLSGEYDHHVINVYRSSKINLVNLYIEKARRIGIAVMDSVDVQTERCLIDNNITFGYCAMANNIDVVNCNIRASTIKNSGWNHICFQRMGGVSSAELFGCGCYDNYMTGICGDIGVSTWSNNNSNLVQEINVVNNTINGMSGIGSGGIAFHGGIKFEVSEGCLAQGNILLDINRGISDDANGGGNHRILNNLIRLKDDAITRPMGVELLTDNNLISNNTIHSPPTAGADGIFASTSENRIIGNTFIQYNPIYFFVAIQTSFGAGGNNVIELNDVRKCNIVYGGTMDVKVTDNLRNNIGYPTENKGSSTGTGGQQTIAHGLVGTPTFVILSNGNAVSNAYQSAAADANNIYVTADNGETWYWYAKIF